MTILVPRGKRLSWIPLKGKNPVRVCCALCFLESACKPEFPAHMLEQAVLPLKPKKVPGTAIYLSHGFHNFPGTLASH